MYIEPFFITGLGIIFSCMLLILIAVIVLYFRSSKALNLVNTEFTLYKREHEAKAREALDAAIKKSQEIITSTQMFSDETKRRVMDSVSKSLSTGSSTYEQIISDLGQKSVGELLTYSDSLKKSIESQTLELTSTFKAQLKNEQSAFHSSLQKGESDILSQVQKRAVDLLPDLLKEACKRAITPQEAESLILVSIEKVKKQHGFS